MTDEIRFYNDIKIEKEIVEKEKKKQSLESFFTIFIKDDNGKLATDGNCYITSDKMQDLMCIGFTNGVRLIKEISGAKNNSLTAKCELFERISPIDQIKEKIIRFVIKDDLEKSVYEQEIKVDHQKIQKFDDKCPIDKIVKKDLLNDGFNRSRIALSLLKLDEKQFLFDAQLIPFIEDKIEKKSVTLGIKRTVSW